MEIRDMNVKLEVYDNGILKLYVGTELKVKGKLEFKDEKSYLGDYQLEVYQYSMIFYNKDKVIIVNGNTQEFKEMTKYDLNMEKVW